MTKNKKEHLLHFWSRNLVGNPTIFTFNLFVVLIFGLLYSFRLLPSPFFLLVLGIVSPVILTICLYHMVSVVSFPNPMPVVLAKKSTRIVLSLMDCAIILLLAYLIFRGTLNYFFFRLLQTVILPALYLLMLRVLLLAEKAD